MLMKILNIFVALLLFATLFIALDSSPSVWSGKDEVAHISIEDVAGGQDAKGEVMRNGIFSDFIFPFELLSLLLLASLIGAIYLAKKEVA